MPFIAAIFGAFFVAIGVLAPAVAAILVPIFMEAAYRLNWDRRGMSICFSSGVMSTAFVETSVVGGVLRGMLATLLPDVDTAAIADAISRGSFIVNAIVFVIGYVIFKGWKIASSQNKSTGNDLFQKPGKPTTAQLSIVVMILLIIMILLVPRMLSGIPLFATISGKVEIAYLYLLQ